MMTTTTMMKIEEELFASQTFAFVASFFRKKQLAANRSIRSSAANTDLIRDRLLVRPGSMC